MLTFTVNETTLAIGASVPTMNDERVTVCVLLAGAEVGLLPQPAAKSVATVQPIRQGSVSLPDFEMNIPDLPSFLRSAGGLTELSRLSGTARIVCRL